MFTRPCATPSAQPVAGFFGWESAWRVDGTISREHELRIGQPQARVQRCQVGESLKVPTAAVVWVGGLEGARCGDVHRPRWKSKTRKDSLKREKLLLVRWGSGYCMSLRMPLAASRPVAAAETIFPATPGPSPATYMPGREVRRSLSVSIWVAKNLISGA